MGRFYPVWIRRVKLSNLMLQFDVLKHPKSSMSNVCQISRVCQQKYIEKFIDVISNGSSKRKIYLKNIATFLNGWWLSNSSQWTKFEFRSWPLAIDPNSLKHREMWFSAGVRMYVCVRVRMYLIINFSNHDIRYNSEAVIYLHSLRFPCKLITNLRFYGI